VQREHDDTERISRLEAERQLLEEQMKKLLHKELDRLKYLEALRYSAPQQILNPVVKAKQPESRQGCGRTGHFYRHCPDMEEIFDQKDET